MSPPLSFAAFSNTLPKKKKNKPPNNATDLAPRLEKLKLAGTDNNTRFESKQPSHSAPCTPIRRLETEEINDDSIYSIYLKKITYTFNNSLNKQASSSNFVTKCDQVDQHSSESQAKDRKRFDDQQVWFLLFD